MDKNNDSSCNHRYIAGYSLRVPQPLFRSLPCDNCGCRIRLTLPWRIIYGLVDLLGILLAYYIAISVNIKFFGSTFLVSAIVFIFLYTIFQLPNRLTLRFGNWISADKK